MIAVTFKITSCKQGEQMPAWEFYLTDINKDDVTVYDLKVQFSKPGNTLTLYPGVGMVKTGAKAVIDYLLPADFISGTYSVEARAILGNGKIYKTATYQFTVVKSSLNG